MTDKNYEIIHVDARYYTLKIWALVLLLSESHVIINEVDVVFRIKRLNNRTLSENRGIHFTGYLLRQGYKNGLQIYQTG